MANSLAEGFIRGTYTGSSGVHHFILPVNYDGVPVPATEPTLTQKGATTVAAITGLAGFLAGYLPFFPSSNLFGLAEAYTVDPDTQERQFIFGWDMGEVGGGGDPVALSMGTLTFKTNIGGLLKITAMDQIFAVNQKVRPPFIAAGVLDGLVDYVVGASSIVVGRDNNYAFAPISYTVKTSDALRKRVGL